MIGQLNEFVAGNGEKVAKAFTVLIGVVAGDATQMISPQVSALGVVIDQVLLSLEALHSSDLLLINLADIDQRTGDEFAQLGLVGLKAKQAHLLGGFGALDTIAIGIGLNATGKDKLCNVIVVRIQDVLTVLVMSDDDIGLYLADLTDHALPNLVTLQGGTHWVIGQIPELDVSDTQVVSA